MSRLSPELLADIRAKVTAGFYDSLGAAKLLEHIDAIESDLTDVLQVNDEAAWVQQYAALEAENARLTAALVDANERMWAFKDGLIAEQGDNDRLRTWLTWALRAEDCPCDQRDECPDEVGNCPCVPHLVAARAALGGEIEHPQDRYIRIATEAEIAERDGREAKLEADSARLKSELNDVVAERDAWQSMATQSGRERDRLRTALGGIWPFL